MVDALSLIRQTREQQGLRQAELAQQAGLSCALVSRMERGAGTFTQPQVMRVVEALGIEPGAVFEQLKVRTEGDLRFGWAKRPTPVDNMNDQPAAMETSERPAAREYLPPAEHVVPVFNQLGICLGEARLSVLEPDRRRIGIVSAVWLLDGRHVGFEWLGIDPTQGTRDIRALVLDGGEMVPVFSEMAR